MSYKFYKSTTTRNVELADGVGVSFELTDSNKNNVLHNRSQFESDCCLINAK